MKSLKLSLIAITLLFTTVTANAVEKTKETKMSIDAIISTYIDAISRGNTRSLDKILDDDLRFNLLHGNDVNTITKSTLIMSMRKTVVVAPLKTSTAIIYGDDDLEKVRITFNYDSYSRIDIVTLSHTVNWNITIVTSSYH